MNLVLLLAFLSLPLPESIGWPLGYAIRDEALYILDGPSARVWVVSIEDGTLLRTIGAKGQGPEELLLPDFFWIQGDQVAVYQMARQQLSLFSMDGRFLKAQRASFFGGYPAHYRDGRFFSLGGPVRLGKPLLNLWSAKLQWEKGFFEPSVSYRKAKVLQDFFLVMGPGTTLFFADPFETRSVTRLDYRTGEQDRITLANPFLLEWNPKGAGPYDLNALWTHDRFHTPAPGFYFEAAGIPFLVLNWIRGSSILDAFFLTQILDLEARSPVQFYKGTALPIGTSARETVLTIEERDTGYFLREIPIREFLENPEGKAPSP